MEAHIECDSCYELRVKRIKEEMCLDSGWNVINNFMEE